MLFDSYRLGRITLANRIVMAPMTRSRSPENVPSELVVTYYAQRASAGLIVTEGTSPSPNGLGYVRIPGIYTREMVAAWRKVTDAVHARGGHIFLQLLHTGRMGHGANLPSGARLLAPSAIAAPGQIVTESIGPQPIPVPIEMTEADILATIAEYGAAATMAIEAGFDGVELHGANGYLIEQFLNVGANQRSDGWGGSVAGRMRFALAAVDAAVAHIGADRVGIRLSPYGAAGGMKVDPDTDALYRTLATELSNRKIAYLHLVDHSALGAPVPKPELMTDIRRAFTGTLIAAGGYDGPKAEAALREGRADLIAFGRPFIANPNLPDKLRRGAPLRVPERETFYSPGEKGYIDYPSD